MLSNVFTELSHVNILLLVAICFISFTKLNYSMLNSMSNIGMLWSRPVINSIFLCLRCISALKVVIAVLRGLIKARKFNRFESKADYMLCNVKYIESSDLIGSKCVICLEDFSVPQNPKTDSNLNLHINSDPPADSDQRRIRLKCNHVFHLDCFKEWYVVSGDCPYCRSKVDL